MRSVLTVLTVIDILGGVQGLFMTLVLISFKRDNYKANKYLSLVVFVLSLTLLVSFLHFTNLILKVPHLMGITPIFILLYGPLLLFYVSSYLKPDYRFTWRRLLHFLPLLVQLIFELPFLMIAGFAKRDYLMNIFEDRFFPRLNPESMSKILHLSIYLIVCYLVYKKTANVTRDNIRVQPAIKRIWIKQLLAGSCIIWGSYLALYFYNLYTLNTVIPILITIAFYAMSYVGFKHPEIVRDVQVKSSSAKYEFSTLTVEDKKWLCEALRRIMEEKKMFRDPELKMSKVAELLNVPVSNLSQAINENFSQNFPEFINTFRIKEAQAKLLDSNSKHLTILAIAYEVGFNSKSAFNAAFKKLTKQTPSQFIKSRESSF